MKIGRNDPCPCGSGKKYKQCCLKRMNRSEYDMIREAVAENQSNEIIADLICNLYRYMNEKQWMGACHATCAVLYVALKELGENVELCIGEVDTGLFAFDHSWILVDGKKIDLAAAITMQGGLPVSGPIAFDKDIRTGLPSDLTYGIYKSGLDSEANMIMNIPFGMYMDNFPDEKNGLWGVLKKVYPGEVDIDSIKVKYSNVERKYVRD